MLAVGNPNRSTGIGMTQRRDGVWVGFDLGGTKMLASVFDSSFEVIGRDRKSTLNSVSPKKNLKRIAKTIDGALAEQGTAADGDCAEGIAIGTIGIDRGASLDIKG